VLLLLDSSLHGCSVTLAYPSVQLLLHSHSVVLVLFHNLF